MICKQLNVEVPKVSVLKSGDEYIAKLSNTIDVCSKNGLSDNRISQLINASTNLKGLSILHTLKDEDTLEETIYPAVILDINEQEVKIIYDLQNGSEEVAYIPVCELAADFAKRFITFVIDYLRNYC